jgi:hypothetical protein
MHHVFIQQAWTSGGSKTIYSSVTANEGLRRIGNGLINLLPIPRSLNNWLGQAGNEWATSMLATIYYSIIVFGLNEAEDAIRDAIALMGSE